MTKIAIDVVLLPSEEMMDKAIEINRELLKENENKIVLDKQKCLPHISLCMGCIEEDNIPKIEESLKKIASQFSTMNLIAHELKPETIPSGKIVSGITINNTKELQSLQETVMKQLWQFLSYDVKISMLFNPPEVEEISCIGLKTMQRNMTILLYFIHIFL